jgi:hypothetical protein
MLERFPFWSRAALLLGVMTVAAAVDFWRRGKEAERYREYGFIWMAGILVGLVGFANDCVTSTISPDYFILGKGLEPGNDLQWRAGMYGFEAGLSAGIIGGAVCMFTRARNARFSTEQMRGLLRKLWMPVAGAAFLGVALPMVASRFDPLGLSARLRDLLDAEQIGHFKRVWWIHTGLYTGLVLGLAAMLIRRVRHES